LVFIFRATFLLLIYCIDASNKSIVLLQKKNRLLPQQRPAMESLADYHARIARSMANDGKFSANSSPLKIKMHVYKVYIQKNSKKKKFSYIQKYVILK
jgi:predicted nuclease with RNAse H fold